MPSSNSNESTKYDCGIDSLRLQTMLRIDLREMLPMWRQIALLIDGGCGANRNTHSTANAFCFIYIKLWRNGKIRFILRRMNAVYRACIHACRVFDVDAWFGNYINHRRFSFKADGISDRSACIQSRDYKLVRR